MKIIDRRRMKNHGNHDKDLRKIWKSYNTYEEIMENIKKILGNIWKSHNT